MNRRKQFHQQIRGINSAVPIVEIDGMTTPVMEPSEAPVFDLHHPSSSSIQILGRHFIDQHGRILNLRGVNVGAASKMYDHIHKHYTLTGLM